MTHHKRSSIVIGLLFILASAAAIAGLLLYAPLLKNPEYMLKGPTSEFHITLGALFELITAAAVAGTAITLFPYLRKRSESRAVAYLGFRLLEAFLIVLGLICLLTVLTLRKQFEGGSPLDGSALQVSATELIAIHDWTFMLGPNFMLGLNTLMYTSVLFQTRLIPRPLAILGIVGALSVFTAAILELFGVITQMSTPGGILAAPVAIFEIAFAVYLIVRGFNPTALADLNSYQSTRT